MPEGKLVRMACDGLNPAWPRCIECRGNLVLESVPKPSEDEFMELSGVSWMCPRCGVPREPRFFVGPWADRP